MPRSKKTKEQKRADTSRESQLAEFWSSRIAAGAALKTDYVDIAKRVKSYMKPTHAELFDDPKLADVFMSFDNSMAVSVPTISKMKNSLAPRLYLPEPERTVSYRGSDNVLKGLARVLQTYLNYTARETTQARELRKTIDDGLVRGRGFLRQIWDPVRKLVTSVYLSSLDVVFDPDFIDPRDAQWIAIRHREPLWQVKERIPKKVLTKGLEKVCTVPETSNDRDKQDPKKDLPASTSRVVEWWEVLSRMGCGYRGLEFEGDDYTDDKDFVRLEVVVGHPRILSEGDWDVPLYLDREWPLSWCDFVELPDTQWPECVAGQVLSCQGAVDLYTSLKLNSIKQRERVVVACDDTMDKNTQNTLKNGSSSDFLPIKLQPGRSLDSVVKVLDFGVGSPETQGERGFLLQEMETTMGSTQMVTGGNDSGAQDRSATASNLRNEATDTRIGDFKAKVAELYTDASRKEAVMIRLFLDEEDVARYVRPADLALFYVSVELADAPPMPVRKVGPGPGTENDAGDDADAKQETPTGLTLQDVDPSLSTYFDSPQDAAMAMQQFWVNLQSSLETEIVQLRDALVQGGIDPATGLPTGLKVDVVTAERVWQDTSGMTAEEVLDELSYSIESGSGIKFNKDAERQNTDFLLQTLLPVVAQMGDIQGLNHLLSMRFDAYDVPQDKRFALNPPAPPPAPPGPAGPAGGQQPKAAPPPNGGAK